jgi:hypothetical protein
MKKLAFLVILFSFIWLYTEDMYAQDSTAINRLYIGTRIGGSIPLHAPTGSFADGGYILDDLAFFDTTFQMSFQIIKNIAIQTEIGYMKENINTSGLGYIKSADGYYYLVNINNTADINILSIPILVKYLYKADKNFFIHLLTGINISYLFGKKETEIILLNYNLAETKIEKVEHTSLVGYISGVVFGFRIGPGNLFVDIRINSLLNNYDQNNIEILYNKNLLNFSLGYEFGFGFGKY